MSVETDVTELKCPACQAELKVEIVHGCQVRRVELSTQWMGGKEIHATSQVEEKR